MLMILAMVLSAAGMKLYEQSKTRAQARWDEARHRAEQRSAERERKRQDRAQEWEQRFDSAISTGPKAVLWWPYAIGWVIGGGIAAVGAGAVGAVSGALAGAKSGYALGAAAGEAGRRYGEAFAAWRRANRGRGEPVDLGLCGRCHGWLVQDLLVADAEYGQVCPDCVPTGRSAADQDTEQASTGRRYDGPSSEDGRQSEAWGGRRRCWGMCGETPPPGRDYCLLCKPDQRRCETGCGRFAAPESPLCASCRRERSAGAGPQEAHGPIWAHAERVYPDRAEVESPPQQLEQASDGDSAAEVVDAEVVDPESPGPMAQVIPISNSKENTMRIEGGIEGVTAKLTQFADHFEQTRGSLTATQDALEAARWNGAPIERIEAARQKLGAVIEDLNTAATSISSGGYGVRDALEAHAQVGSDESVRAQ